MAPTNPDLELDEFLDWLDEFITARGLSLREVKEHFAAADYAHLNGEHYCHECGCFQQPAEDDPTRCSLCYVPFSV